MSLHLLKTNENPPHSSSALERGKMGGEKGFTLLELLIAMAIGAIVLLAAYNVFVSQQKSHKLQSELVDAQQNARSAFDLLTRELRLAGAGVQRAILNSNITGGTTTSLSVVSATGFCNGEVINIIAPTKSDAVTITGTLTDSCNPPFCQALPCTGITLTSAPTNSYTYTTEDVSIFKEKITSATENSIAFRAPIYTKETVLFRGANSGATTLYISNGASDNFSSGDTIFIDDGGGRFERLYQVIQTSSSTCPATGNNNDCDTLTLNTNPPLLNSYPIGSKVNTGVTTVTYAFDSPNDRITRDIGSGAQPFAENIDYFQIKYYDGSNNPIPNPAPSPYTGVSLTATERAKIRKVNIQIVAISSKDDTNYTETGTYDDGTTYANRGSTNRRRLFLEADILMTNMAP